MQTMQAQRPSAPEPAAVAAPPASAPVKLIEVELRQLYCPFFLVNEDGTVTPNDTEITKTVEPGLVRLHKEDAQRVLGLQIALPTRNTWADL